MVMAFLFSDQAQQGQFKMADITPADAYQSHRNERENATFCRFLQKNGLLTSSYGNGTFGKTRSEVQVDRFCCLNPLGFGV
jgi:hypothetical protein